MLWHGAQWVGRYTAEGPAGLQDRSSRPQRCIDRRRSLSSTELKTCAVGG
ncbi:MAG: hypothetical protein GEV13_31775 [Rhodospirillales bacterium]|nr:hypothetical protein [Rhodospirillales bacterium]